MIYLIVLRKIKIVRKMLKFICVNAIIQITNEYLSREVEGTAL